MLKICMVFLRWKSRGSSRGSCRGWRFPNEPAHDGGDVKEAERSCYSRSAEHLCAVHEGRGFGRHAEAERHGGQHTAGVVAFCLACLSVNHFRCMLHHNCAHISMDTFDLRSCSHHPWGCSCSNCAAQAFTLTAHAMACCDMAAMCQTMQQLVLMASFVRLAI